MRQPYEVPREWTAEQALAIVEWMQGIIDTLWDLYGDELTELLADRTIDFSDDSQFELPF